MVSIREIKSRLRAWLDRPEYVYLVIALIGVVGFSLITPPFQGPDEPEHYAKVQFLSRGQFIASGNDTLPASLRTTLKKTFFDHDIRGTTSAKYDFSRTLDALNDSPEAVDTQQYPVISYSPVGYIPAVVAVFISNHLGGSMAAGLYLARLALGLTAVALWFVAIRVIPTKKYLYMAIGLTPMMLFQQSVVSVDGLSYAFLALFVAYVTALYSQPVIHRRQWWILLTLCVMVGLAKPLLYLFLPLVFILMNKRRLQPIGISLVAVAVLLLWNIVLAPLATSGGTLATVSPSNVNPQQQIEYLVHHPGKIVRVAWNSYMTDYGDEEVRGMVGIFGYADTAYPLWMYTYFCVTLAAIIITNPDRRSASYQWSKVIGRAWKYAALGMSAVYFAGVNAALYLSYTPVGFPIVYGVQGRYFLPLMIVIAGLAIGNGMHLTEAQRKRVRPWVVGSLAVLVLLAVFIVFQRFYLYTP